MSETTSKYKNSQFRVYELSDFDIIELSDDPNQWLAKCTDKTFLLPHRYGFLYGIKCEELDNYLMNNKPSKKDLDLLLRSLVQMRKVIHDRRRYLRTIPCSSSLDPLDGLVISSDVFDIFPFLFKQQEEPPAWPHERLTKEAWEHMADKSITVSNLAKKFDILGFDKSLITLVPDIPFEIRRRHMKNSFVYPLIFSVNGESGMTRSQALLNIFQRLVCGVNWSRDYCNVHPKCLETLRYNVNLILADYACSTGVLSEEKISSAIRSIAHCSSNYPENGQDYKLDTLPYTSNIPWDSYQKTCQSYGLRVYDNIWKRGVIKKEIGIPVWLARFLYIAGWLDALYPLSARSAIFGQIELIWFGLKHKIPEEMFELCQDIWNEIVWKNNRDKVDRWHVIQAKLGNNMSNGRIEKRPDNPCLMNENEIRGEIINHAKNNIYEVSQLKEDRAIRQKMGVVERFKQSLMDGVKELEEEKMKNERKKEDSGNKKSKKQKKNNSKTSEAGNSKASITTSSDNSKPAQSSQTTEKLNETKSEVVEPSESKTKPPTKKSTVKKGKDQSKPEDSPEDSKPENVKPKPSSEPKPVPQNSKPGNLEPKSTPEEKIAPEPKSSQQEKSKLCDKCTRNGQKLLEAQEELKLAVNKANKYEEKAKKTIEMEKNSKKIKKENEELKKEIEIMKSKIKELEGKETKLMESNKNLVENNEELKNEVTNEQQKTYNEQQKIAQLTQKVDAIQLKFTLKQSQLESELEKKTGIIEELRRTNSRISGTSSDPSTSNLDPLHPRKKLLEYQRIKDDFEKDQSLDWARATIKKLSSSSDNPEVWQFCEFEMDQFENCCRIYMEIVELNIRKIKKTDDISDLFPLPKYPELSNKFLEKNAKSQKASESSEPSTSSDPPTASTESFTPSSQVGFDPKLECYICNEPFLEGEKVFVCKGCNNPTHQKCGKHWSQAQKELNVKDESCGFCRRRMEVEKKGKKK